MTRSRATSRLPTLMATALLLCALALLATAISFPAAANGEADKNTADPFNKAFQQDGSNSSSKPDSKSSSKPDSKSSSKPDSKSNKSGCMLPLGAPGAAPTWILAAAATLAGMIVLS